MVIKCNPHKGNSIRMLINYVIDGMRSKDDMIISHNLPSFDPQEITKAFLVQDKYRQMGKGINRWYHNKLSFRPSDTKHLDNNTLERLTQEYIDRRCKNALAFATAHLGEAHVHVHVVFSATEYRSKKNLFLNNKEFMGIRMEMERYQQGHFPELKSIVYLNRTKKKRRGQAASKEREYQAKLRLGNKVTEKEQLSAQLEELYDEAQSMVGFIDAIENAGISLYYRNGKAAGVLGKRKYRFKTLGITKDMFQALRRLEEREKEIDGLTGSDGGERER